MKRTMELKQETNNKNPQILIYNTKIKMKNNNNVIVDFINLLDLQPNLNFCFKI